MCQVNNDTERSKIMYDAQTRKRAEEILKGLHANTKDCIYRILWKERVAEDVYGVLEEGIDTQGLPNNEIVEWVSEQYCFEGNYDCNVAYWDQLRGLVEQYVYYQTIK